MATIMRGARARGANFFGRLADIFFPAENFPAGRPLARPHNHRHTESAIPQGRLYSTRLPLFHKAAFIPRGFLYSTRLPLFHEAAFVPRGRLCSTRPPLLHEASFIPRGQALPDAPNDQGFFESTKLY